MSENEEYVKIIQRKPKARWVPDEHEGVYSEMEMDFWLQDLQAFTERHLEYECTGLAYLSSK